MGLASLFYSHHRKWSGGAAEYDYPWTENNFFVDWVRHTREGKQLRESPPARGSKRPNGSVKYELECSL